MEPRLRGSRVRESWFRWAGCGQIMVLVGSLIEAVIYDGSSSPGTALPAGVRTVALRAGLIMLPLTGELAARLGQAAGEERIRPRWVLRQPIARPARQLSAA